MTTINHFLTDENHPPYSERDNVKLARAQRDSHDGWLVTDMDGQEIAFVKDGTHWWVLPGVSVKFDTHLNTATDTNV